MLWIVNAIDIGSLLFLEAVCPQRLVMGTLARLGSRVGGLNLIRMSRPLLTLIPATRPKAFCSILRSSRGRTRWLASLSGEARAPDG